jgi:Family of unknown function (DUF6236)
MLGSALYYPHIDIDDPQWLRSAVLYWDEIKTIAPSAVRKPYKNKDTNILWKEGFLEPLRCDLNPEVLDTLGRRVVSLMDRGWNQNSISHDDPNAGVLMHAEKFGHEIRHSFRRAHIHPDKLSPELRSIAMQAGLARMHSSKMSPYLDDLLQELEFVSMHPGKMSPNLLHLMERVGRHSDRDGDWLLVDSQFAAAYMSALAALLAKEAELAALTNEDRAMGVNLHALLEDVKPSSGQNKAGALVSFVMETIKVDPDTKIENLLNFRRQRETQLAELSAQFDDLSAKMGSCETDRQLEIEARKAYENKIRPKLEALKQELSDNSVQSIWEGFTRSVMVAAAPTTALAYFTGVTGTTLLAAGAAIAITDVSVKTHLARRKARRASPFTYLLDVERKFGSNQFA